MKYDVLIIGSGVAGLTVASFLPPDKKVLLLTKNNLDTCNSYWAQGGVAMALDEEDVASHVEDTMNAGAGLCDREAVEMLSRRSIDVVSKLISDGMPFDTGEGGRILFTKEAAHARSRVIHAGGDATGTVLHRFLRQKLTCDVMENAVVADLLLGGGRCYGAAVVRGEERLNVYAEHTVIASGGLGALYQFSTNARGLGGDLHGICLKHGLPLQDMAFLQFHPTVFVRTDKAQKLLLTEALRGEGALIVDDDGKRFLCEYDPRCELASRDQVSRAIFLHRKKTGKGAWLDLRNFRKEAFKERFPTVYRTMQEVGYDLPGERIPISPAFHYAMGGIKTGLDTRVAGMENLYCVGEAASNRVHGANRLASNSLLEGLVFGKIAAENIQSSALSLPEKEFPLFKEPLERPEDGEIKEALRHMMWDNVGIIRTPSGLREAQESINSWLEAETGHLLKLRLLTAKEIVRAARERTQSVGAHYITNQEG